MRKFKLFAVMYVTNTSSLTFLYKLISTFTTYWMFHFSCGPVVMDSLKIWSCYWDCQIFHLHQLLQNTHKILYIKGNVLSVSWPGWRENFHHGLVIMRNVAWHFMWPVYLRYVFIIFSSRHVMFMLTMLSGLTHLLYLPEYIMMLIEDDCPNKTCVRRKNVFIHTEDDPQPK